MNKLLSNKTFWIQLIIPVFACFFIVGCGDDDEPGGGGGGTEDPIASFQYEIDADDFLTVQFSNFSQNANGYSWDFGDGASSDEESPSHTYAAGGSYTVTLTASNDAGTSSMRSESFTLTDPNAALKLLTGETSKTWKLFREGTSMSLGPNADSPAEWWSGLQNDGSRPCLYEQEFTFNLDGSYTFDDKGMFWAEFGVFNNVADCDQNITEEQCFDATAANMVNACGDDVSAWLSGTHNFDYNTATGELTLTGMGAWIGIPKLGTDGEVLTPAGLVTTQISIEEFDGYDVMTVVFDYGGAYWPIRYASYSDSSLEPALETEAQEFGEDWDDISPASGDLATSFMDASAGTLDTILSATGIVYGVADPADGSALCGEFIRTDAQFQELQLQTSPDKRDINFENLTSVSLDVYFPSSNDYTTALTKNVIIGFSDRSKTEQWWTDHQQFELDGTDLAEDEWITVTFELNAPTFVAIPDNGATPYDRNDYDTVFINIGSSNHTDTGTFYVRNLRLD